MSAVHYGFTIFFRMSAEDIFRETGDIYLRLIHPVWPHEDFREGIAPLVALAPSVPDGLVSAMITADSWRERLLGLAMAMAKAPSAFTDAMVRSLRDLRGIAIVPACAALGFLGRRGLVDLAQFFPGEFDLTAFDGEMGWAIDRALGFAKGQPTPGKGPNYGQAFDDQIQVYEWIFNQRHGAKS